MKAHDLDAYRIKDQRNTGTTARVYQGLNLGGAKDKNKCILV